MALVYSGAGMGPAEQLTPPEVKEGCKTLLLSLALPRALQTWQSSWPVWRSSQQQLLRENANEECKKAP